MDAGRQILITGGISESWGKPHKIWRISDETGEAETLMEDIVVYSDISLDKAGKKLLAVQSKNSFQVSLSSFSNPNSKKVLASASKANFISDNEIAYSTNDGELWKELRKYLSL